MVISSNNHYWSSVALLCSVSISKPRWYSDVVGVYNGYDGITVGRKGRSMMTMSVLMPRLRRRHAAVAVDGGMRVIGIDSSVGAMNLLFSLVYIVIPIWYNFLACL